MIGVPWARKSVRPVELGKASRGKVPARSGSNPALSAAATTLTETRVTAHAGPMPAPDTLDGYERVLPGSAERILRMAEKQQEGRLQLERMQLQADIDHRNEMAQIQRAVHRGSFISDYIGQAFGVIVALACVGFAAYAGIWKENWIVAALFLSLPVVGIVQAVRGMKQKPPGDK